ncbi:PHD finger protein MALE MEIOCYTE DEATH 1 [Vitis vinifera]|uniref:PHD finger protein MALE MEIOCYTE DEATH 1 n=1 Tax=Vitis vinifera TaxID=29760 RepID=A0A438HBG1_VITVI|nr:PHD finger protein MALE MEIOCYTE DEATH 1 [Vitis vinifera]
MPARRLEYAADVIVNALREKRASECTHDGMTRQEVRDAARMHIGDTATRVLEYTLKELGKGTLVSELESEMLPKPFPEQSIVRGADGGSGQQALCKGVPFSDEDDQLLRFVCHMMPSLSELEIFTRELPPGEFIVVVVTEIEDMEGMTDEEVLFGTIESGSEVWMRGTGMDLEAELKYEGGSDNWRHTVCSGIDDSETVPPLFVCPKCCALLVPARSESSDCGRVQLAPVYQFGMELLY